MHTYDGGPEDALYGEEAAAALGVAPAAGLQDPGGRASTGARGRRGPRLGELDLKALAAALGGKRATMADRPPPSAPPAT